MPASLPPLAPGGASDALSNATPKLTLSQDGLYFPVPTAGNVENIIEIRNDDESIVLFKVKTSNPDRYIVRPKVGVLHPKSSHKVRFILLASHAPLSAESPKPDRFSLESRFTTIDDAVDDPAACWARKAGAVPSVGKVHLSCRFTAAGSALPEGIKAYLDKPSGLRAASLTSSASGAQLHTPRGGESAPRSASPDSPVLPPSTSGEFVPPPVHARAPTNSFDNTAGSATAAAVQFGDVTMSTLVKAREAARQHGDAAQPAAAAVLNKAGVKAADAARAAGSAVASAPLSPGASSNASTVVDKFAAQSPTVSRSGGPASHFADEATSPTDPRRRRCSSFDRAVHCTVPIYVLLPLMVACVVIGLRAEQYTSEVEEWALRLWHVMVTPIMKQ